MVVRVDVVVRAAAVAAVLLAAAVPFLVAALVAVWFEVVALAFGTRGRFSVVVCREGGKRQKCGCGELGRLLFCFVRPVAKPSYETVRVHLAAVNTLHKRSLTWQEKKK